MRGDEEWICGIHWRVVPAFLRRRKARLYRRYRRLFGNSSYWTFPAGSPKRLEAVRLNRLCVTAWKICKRAAIQRAAGI